MGNKRPCSRAADETNELPPSHVSLLQRRSAQSLTIAVVTVRRVTNVSANRRSSRMSAQPCRARAFAFLSETEAANEAKKLVEKEGRKAVLMPSDLQDARHCGKVIKKTVVDDLCGID